MDGVCRPHVLLTEEKKKNKRRRSSTALPDFRYEGDEQNFCNCGSCRRRPDSVGKMLKVLLFLQFII